MNITHEKLISAVIEKSRKICPGSLALVGIYGSTMTGDTHPKSDLDLLILINDPAGQALADTFILEDEGIAYDLYCTTWQMLENDAEVPHARIAKLMDSKIAYVGQNSALSRLEDLRNHAKSILSSPNERLSRADDLLTKLKIAYANAACADSFGKTRLFAAQSVDLALDAVMLYSGRYFHKGIKRTFEELHDVPQPVNFRETIDKIITAADSAALTSALTELLKSTSAFLKQTPPPSQPTPESLTGTAEEMYSNWKNKLPSAAESGDRFTSFMILAAFQSMLDDVTAGTTVQNFTPLNDFSPDDLHNNVHAFDNTYKNYVRECEKAGVKLRKFKTADDFIQSYLK